MINVLRKCDYFKTNQTFSFYFIPQIGEEHCKINVLYSSLSKICNVSTKSITDPQYYKTVLLFINTAISSGKYALEGEASATSGDTGNEED
jgi:hypothetical protein